MPVEDLPVVASRPERLLVIVPDAISLLRPKGEVPRGYYNPGGLFREVHLLLTNDDRPDADLVQTMVGDATPYVHNLPPPWFARSIGRHAPLIRGWVQAGVALVARVQPTIVRTMNNFIEGYLAAQIKRELGIPYVVSLHGVWDRDCLATPRQRIERQFRKRLETYSLEHADAVIAVYKPIMRYAREHGAKRVELIYNVVAGEALPPKSSYELSQPPRLITVNRQCDEKNPANIIRAIADIDCRYLIVGDGPLHESLKALVRGLRLESKVEFRRGIPNEELCHSYRDFDLMVSHCEYWGVSKTLIEGALVGLPIIVNQHSVEPVEDYEGNWVRLCSNSPADYHENISALLSEQHRRAQLGRHARNHALAHFDPSVMERRIVGIYTELIDEKESSPSPV